jgi:hypothetical protein
MIKIYKIIFIGIIIMAPLLAGLGQGQLSNPGMVAIRANSGSETQLEFKKYWDYQETVYKPERKRSHKRRRKLKPPKGPKPK